MPVRSARRCAGASAEIVDIDGEFATSAWLAREAGVKLLELHAARGCLVHSFLSPISNRRNDAYGGDTAGRSRFLMGTLDAIRSEWPAHLPLWVQLSCVDRAPGGLTIDDTVAPCRRLAARGDVDLIDCSSGGVAARALGVKPELPAQYLRAGL